MLSPLCRNSFTKLVSLLLVQWIFSRSYHSLFLHVLFTWLPLHCSLPVFFLPLCHYFSVSLEGLLFQSVSYILLFFYVLFSTFLASHSVYFFPRQSYLLFHVELPDRLIDCSKSNVSRAHLPSACASIYWISIGTPQTHTPRHLSPRFFF